MTTTRTHTQINRLQRDDTKMKVYDPMAVTWMDKYNDTLDKYWKKLPVTAGSLIASVAVFLLGATVRGEWIHIFVHFMRAFYGEVGSHTSGNTTFTGLSAYRLQGLPYYWLASVTVSYAFYLGIGGFLHWYYYVNRRHLAHEWKCQPHHWISPELERHEILLGTFSLMIGSTISSIISCYIANGGSTYIYYDVADYGWLWYCLSWPVTFIHQDYLTYWHHRMYHHPLLYKHFHKLHHKYKQPTAFSVTAIHPVEFINMQAVLVSPMALFPVHWSVFVTLLMYLYYHGIIDHSGINFKAYWWQPWQPDCIFHDNHHQYSHVNFGFNCELWDKLHGTYRQKDKVYNEDIYHGCGKDIAECNEEELQADLEGRQSENSRAHRGRDKEELIRALVDKIGKNK